ncbi:hypothetical protein CBL_20979 [Carabus blaptoides fortunei]
MEFKPPRGLNLEGDVSQNWKDFKQKFDIFLEANEYTSKTDAIKIAMLLNCIGDEALALYNTFKINENEGAKYDSQESETFDHYQTELKKLSHTCEFGEKQDSLIRDKIIIGIKDKTLQERLLREENLMLSKVIDVCRVFELSKNEAKSLQNVNNVDVISEIGSGKSDELSNKSKRFKCTRCNREHGANQCPAFGQMCHKCVEERNSTSKEELFSVNKVELNKDNNVDEWYHNISINNVSILFKLDIGADVNVMPYNIYEKLCSVTQLQPTESKIFKYGGAQKKQFVEENKDIFNGLGKLPFTYRIRLIEDVDPVVKPARRIPHAIKIKLKQTLEKMEKINIISKVTIPTDWVNVMVIVEKKDGSLRICLSPLELNKYIKREVYHIPTEDELTANIAATSQDGGERCKHSGLNIWYANLIRSKKSVPDLTRDRCKQLAYQSDVAVI